jgi:hypothetical protein
MSEELDFFKKAEDEALHPHKRESVKQRIGILAVGILGNYAMVWGFDFVLYPFIIWKFGLVYGWLIMMVLSAVICLLTLWFYDWAREDWLGIETIKEVKDFEKETGWRKFLAKLMSKSEWLMLVILSIQFDPFITVIYMRRGAHKYNGMSKRDWRIFLTSLIIGDIYWSLLAFGGVSVIVWLWHLIFSA